MNFIVALSRTSHVFPHSSTKKDNIIVAQSVKLRKRAVQMAHHTTNLSFQITPMPAVRQSQSPIPNVMSWPPSDAIVSFSFKIS
jgi:hypothetical protein